MIFKSVLLLSLVMLVGCIPEERQSATTTTVTVAATTVTAAKAAPPTTLPAPAAQKPAQAVTAKSTKDIKDLETALQAGVPVVVKLGSDSCYPCRQMNPVIKELAVEQDGKAIFLSLDVYQNRELARQAQVRVIPTILFYDRHGNPRAKVEGGMSKEDLLKTINELEVNQ